MKITTTLLLLVGATTISAKPTPIYGFCSGGILKDFLKEAKGTTAACNAVGGKKGTTQCGFPSSKLSAFEQQCHNQKLYYCPGIGPAGLTLYEPIKCTIWSDKPKDPGKDAGKDKGKGQGNGSHGSNKKPSPPPDNDSHFVKFPGKAWFKTWPYSPIVTKMGNRLKAEGCGGSYKVGPSPQWTAADIRAYSCWQKKQGFSDGGADGWPGEQSWNALKVPK